MQMWSGGGRAPEVRDQAPLASNHRVHYTWTLLMVLELCGFMQREIERERERKRESVCVIY